MTVSSAGVSFAAMRNFGVLLLLTLLAGCSSTAAGGLIEDVEYSYSADEGGLAASDYDGEEYSFEEEWSPEEGASSGGSIGSALDDHVRSCIAGWSFTGRAISRRISRDLARFSSD